MDGMPEYRRHREHGGAYFFTVVTYHRLPILTGPGQFSSLCPHGMWKVDGQDAASLTHPTSNLEAIADVFSNYAAGNINIKETAGRDMNNFVTEMLSIYIWQSIGSRTFK